MVFRIMEYRTYADTKQQMESAKDESEFTGSMAETVRSIQARILRQKRSEC